jgi:hypothetical protein
MRTGGYHAAIHMRQLLSTIELNARRFVSRFCVRRGLEVSIPPCKLPPCKRDNSKAKKAERDLAEDCSINGEGRLVSSKFSGTVVPGTDYPLDVNLSPHFGFLAHIFRSQLLASARGSSGASRQNIARVSGFRQMVVRSRWRWACCACPWKKVLAANYPPRTGKAGGGTGTRAGQNGAMPGVGITLAGSGSRDAEPLSKHPDPG